MRPAAPAAGTQWGDFAGSAEDAIAEDPSTLMAETQWGDFAGGADGETGEDPITLQPLQPGHTVFIVSPDGSTKMSYNISTLRQIAESKGTWMQPPHFREPMQPDLKARIEILEPATAGPLAVQPRHAEMSDLDRDLWEEFGYGGGNRIVVAYGRRHQQLLERHWGLGHVSQKKIYVCGYCWKTAVEATHAEGDSDASAGGRRMLRREAYLSRPAPSSSASQAREPSDQWLLETRQNELQPNDQWFLEARQNELQPSDQWFLEARQNELQPSDQWFLEARQNELQPSDQWFLEARQNELQPNDQWFLEARQNELQPNDQWFLEARQNELQPNDQWFLEARQNELQPSDQWLLETRQNELQPSDQWFLEARQNELQPSDQWFLEARQNELQPSDQWFLEARQNELQPNDQWFLEARQNELQPNDQWFLEARQNELQPNDQWFLEARQNELQPSDQWLLETRQNELQPSDQWLLEARQNELQPSDQWLLETRQNELQPSDQWLLEAHRNKLGSDPTIRNKLAASRSLGPVKTPPVPDARTPASQEPLQCGPAYAIPDTPPPRVVRPAAGRAGPNPGASRCLFTPRARSQQSGNPQPQQVPGCQRQWSQQLACNLQLQRTQQLAGNLQLQRTQQLPGNLQLQRTQQLPGNLQLQRTQQLPGNLQPASVHSSQAPPATQTAASLPQRERGFAGALRTRGGRVPKRRRTTCVQDSTTSDDSESGLLIDEEEEEEEEAEEEAEESPVDLTGLDTEGICPAFLRRQLEKRGLTQRRPAASQDTQDAPPARLLNNPLRVLWEMPDREAAWPSVLFKDKKSAVAHIKSAHGGSGGEVVEDVRDLIDAYLREANERLLAAPWFDHTNEQHVHCLTTTRLAFWNRDARYNANCYNTILAAVRAVGPETDTTRFVAGGRDDAAAASDVESLVADDSSSSPRPAPPPRRRPAKRRRTPAGSARANKRRRRTRTARGSDSS
ncbi:Repetitive proline-rich cell wall protein 2 [Diplonema papillatum]|nr:Repetitive proline-rich cell wall protein 2 [Diplonema papillatum]